MQTNSCERNDTFEENNDMKEKLYALWGRIKRLIDLSEFIDVEASAKSIKENIGFRGPNLVILFCAIVIASVGLNVNSIPVIIGAMLISPLMSPIVGLGMALGTNDTKLLRASLKNLGIMVGISILASTLYFLLSPLDMEHPTELLARTNPTIYDVLIALFGGFAGIVESSRKDKGTVVVGVAIATALMPPLCTVGYGLSTLNPTFIFGALYLFFINLTFIALAAFVGTKYLGYKPVKEANEALQRRSRILIAIVLVALIVPSVLSGISVIKENEFVKAANSFATANKSLGRSYIFDYKLHTDVVPSTVELFIAGEELSVEEYAALYASAEKYGLLHEQVLIRQDAANREVSLNENEIVRDILRQNEEKLQGKNKEISSLRQEVDSLKSLLEKDVLPSDQITAEVMTQYPEIEHVMLARMEDGGIVLVATTAKKKALSEEKKDMLEAWLKVRLGATSAKVITE